MPNGGGTIEAGERRDGTPRPSTAIGVHAADPVDLAVDHGNQSHPHDVAHEGPTVPAQAVTLAR